MESNKGASVRKRLDFRFYLRWVLWYRLTRPLRWVGRILARVFTIRRVAFLLVNLALVQIYFYRVEWEELLPNIITDLLGVALAVFILDTMYRVRADTELKKVLIEKLGSKNNTVASEAAHDLDAQGWLSDGTMKRAFLIGANIVRERIATCWEISSMLCARRDSIGKRAISTGKTGALLMTDTYRSRWHVRLAIAHGYCQFTRCACGFLAQMPCLFR